MVLAMLLGGLRCCEVLGRRLRDVRAGERRLFIAEGKGGHQRVVPVSGGFFASLAGYLGRERPQASTDRVFVVLRGPTRGRPLTAEGVDQVLTGARDPAGLATVICSAAAHLPDPAAGGRDGAGDGAGAGRPSLDRIDPGLLYLHLANGWLAGEYARAVTAIEDDTAALRDADGRGEP